MAFFRPICQLPIGNRDDEPNVRCTDAAAQYPKKNAPSSFSTTERRTGTVRRMNDTEGARTIDGTSRPKTLHLPRTRDGTSSEKPPGRRSTSRNANEYRRTLVNETKVYCSLYGVSDADAIQGRLLGIRLSPSF
jgi:hypothetical protein